MKIQYASDLHLEFEENTDYLISNPLKVTGDILILAGDIHVFGSEGFMENPFWDWASKNYKQVIIAYGNHEYYKECDLSTMKDGYKYKIRDNVYYYYNCVITIEDVDIIVSTLWSFIHKENEHECVTGVNDFVNESLNISNLANTVELPHTYTVTGKSPETAKEAYYNSRNYINTWNSYI